MKLFSEAAEYGLRTAIWLADHPGQLWTIREIAAGTRSKPGYLIRVIQMLARAGIVLSQRGVGGGVSLNVDPGRLTVLDVINAVDPMARIKTCPLGLKSHGTNLCSMHSCIDETMGRIEVEFAKVTIFAMLNDATRTHPMRESADCPVNLGGGDGK